MEETSESKEEELEALTKKGIKLNKYYREQETAKEEEEGKKTSLDHLVKPFLSEKKTWEQSEGRKDRVGPLSIKK